MKNKILIFESTNGVAAFEPKDAVAQTSKHGCMITGNGFIIAKDWLNSSTLKTGTFPKMMFNSDLCRAATEKETEDYLQLKAHSKFAP